MSGSGANDAVTSEGPNILGERLLPVPEPEHQPYWDALRGGELRIQQCSSCDSLRHSPQPLCPRCRGAEYTWARMSGRGTVYSYVVTHQATNAAFRDQTPFATVLVELEEGPRLYSNLVGVAPEAITIGMPVEVVFHAVTEEITLPLFRRATS